MTVIPFGIRETDAPLLERVRALVPEIAGRAAGYDERAELPIEDLDALHTAGLTRAVLPAHLGGEGVSYQAFGEVIRLIAQANPSTATLVTMGVGAGVGLAELTHDSLGDFFAQELLAGKHFANALSEPASGNRFFNPQQVADPAEGGWTLDGAKRFVSGSEIADYLLVNALVEDVPTFFAVVPDDTVSIVPIWDTLGLRATRSQLLSFDHTLLKAEHRGRSVQPGDFATVPAGLPAISLGVADAALAAIVEHAANRQILGAPLNRQAWLQHEIAAVGGRLEAVRAYFQRTLWQADAGDPSFFPNLSTAKYLTNKIAVEVAQLAVRVGGASGFLHTSPIQRHLRDAQAGQLMAYSTEVLAGDIGKHLLGVAEEA